MEDATKDTLAGQIRVLLGFAAGAAVGHGYVTADVATAAVGLASAVIPMAWSWWSHRQAETKVQARVEKAVEQAQGGS